MIAEAMALMMTAICVRSQFMRGLGMPSVNSRKAKSGASCSERRWK